MEQATRRSGGWTFLLTGRGNSRRDPDGVSPPPPARPIEMIRYDGADCQLFDSKSLMEWTEQVRCLEGEDICAFLKVIPPMIQLVRSIPQSLALIDTIYKKCETLKNAGKCEFRGQLLRCEDLMQRLLWWYAHAEQEQHTLNKRCETGPVSHRSLNQGERFLSASKWTKLEQLHFSDHVRSILGVLQRQCGHILDEAQSDRAQIGLCLEALGCHGLVNCSSGLIRLQDAVHFELGRHSERLKAAYARHKDITKSKAILGTVPSKAGHQRQMNLRLTEVCERLKQSESAQGLLEELLSTQHVPLNSLLRIVRKRVQSDKLLLSLYQTFAKSTPGDFAITDNDPIVARVVVVFKNAYDKLLSLAPAAETDSGCGIDDSDFDCSSPDTAEDPPKTDSKLLPLAFPLPPSGAPRKLNRVNGPAAQRRHRYRHQSALQIRSLSELNRESASCENIDSPPPRNQLKTAKSLTNIVNGEPSRRFFASPMRRRKNPLPNGNQPDHQDKDDVDTGEMIRLRIQVSDLSDELWNARQQIAQLQLQPKPINGFPAPDYPGSPTPPLPTPPPPCRPISSSTSALAEIERLVDRFAGLYVRDRHEITRTLDSLPEFCGSEELQLKTMFTVIVLTYRSVADSVQRRRERIWALLDETEQFGAAVDRQLDDALYAHMHRRAKSDHGMANAREVTAQIWKTLYDFPSLKTCTRFNRFILECVAVVWDLVAGIEGRPPRTRIEYESCQFDPTRHQRSHRASPMSSVIKCYLWPSLIDCDTDRTLFKGIVIT